MSATGIATAAVLAAGVTASWLGAAAFARLSTPLARLHALTFINVTTGGAITLAAFLSDGLSARALKCLLLWATLLLAGALLSHASGRALLLRDGRRL
jgi:multicomponent Na+:H+ antiporter subunit G